MVLAAGFRQRGPTPQQQSGSHQAIRALYDLPERGVLLRLQQVRACCDRPRLLLELAEDDQKQEVFAMPGPFIGN